MNKAKKRLKIIFVDDEKQQRDIMELLLVNEGYQIRTFSCVSAALTGMKKEEPDIVITDLRMEGRDGISFLEEIRQKYRTCKVILLTGYGSIENAVEAMKKGAWSYFVKGNGPEALLEELRKLQLACQAEARTEGNEKAKQKYMLDTKSDKFRRVLNMLERAAKSSAHILLLGESGVGKEVLANYVHQLSRPDKKFLAVNCHALSENLVESELFGHEKGAFTGAVSTHIGRFEAVEGGTLFLDEIGDVPLYIQSKLLRTLETETIERVGSTKSIHVEFRLVSATNVEMEQAMEQGDFREDLYYRLSTITVVIPPLRERKEDLPDLINFFLDKFCRQQGKEIVEIPEEVWKALLSYSYRGNIRELRNIIERLVVLSEDGKVYPEDLPEQVQREQEQQVFAAGSLKNARVRAEKEQIILALEQSGFRVKEAAAVLDISERQLFNKLKEYEINLKNMKKR